MTWRPTSRTAAAAALYAAAEDDCRARPERYRLDVGTVLDRATDSGGRSTDRFAEGWEDGLIAYLGSAVADGRLNAVGRRMVQDAAVGRLRAGARIAAAVEAHDDGADEILPPIVIIGGWRTGTTYLFRLLGSDPRLHAPLPAELTAPWRLSGLDASRRMQLIDRAAAAHEYLHLLNPTMAAVHESGPRLPEECVLAMGADFRNWGFTSTVRLDSYAHWLAGQDLSASYARHRQVLGLLAVGDPRRFVLKAPAHTAELDHVAAAFPGATIVHLHRDIVDTVASGASLFAVFRSTYSDDVDPVDVGRFQAAQTELWFRRARAFRRSTAADAATFVDLDYEQLVADPASALASVYDAAGIAPPSDVPAMIEGYRTSHPRHARGTHRYTPEDFGLDPDELRRRFADLER